MINICDAKFIVITRNCKIYLVVYEWMNGWMCNSIHTCWEWCHTIRVQFQATLKSNMISALVNNTWHSVQFNIVATHGMLNHYREGSDVEYPTVKAWLCIWSKQHTALFLDDMEGIGTTRHSAGIRASKDQQFQFTSSLLPKLFKFILGTFESQKCVSFKYFMWLFWFHFDTKHAAPSYIIIKY